MDRVQQRDFVLTLALIASLTAVPKVCKTKLTTTLIIMNRSVGLASYPALGPLGLRNADE